MTGETRAPPPLLFAAREQRLSDLDALSRKHWLGGLTHALGTLEPRLATLARLRHGLCAGELPAPDQWHWPERALAGALHHLLLALELPRYCRGQSELADTVVMSVLFHLDFIVDFRDRGASAEQAAAMALDGLRNDWQQHRGHLDELVEVFGQLPDDHDDPRWDQLLGLLQSSGWQQVLRVRRLLERLPELARIIAALGRDAQTDEPQAQAPSPLPLSEPLPLPQTRSVDARVPEMPGETRGVRRSDRIARMLPAEAMLLGHARLRLVWHARRAERTLLSYDEDDHLREQRRQNLPMAVPRAVAALARRRVRGPILVCIDTSASMQGGAEAVAKAVVLEAMRCAHAQARACHLFAFGGPGELIEMELPLTAQGIASLTAFLSQGFRGGTDICGPLEAALGRLEERRWMQADLLLASDGEFGATPAIAERLRAVKRAIGLRVQGVLVADRETIGFLEVADDIFPVRDWRAFDQEAAGNVPVHTHRLTALYFPGALRSPENRAAALSPAAAAQAIRSGRTPP